MFSNVLCHKLSRSVVTVVTSYFCNVLVKNLFVFQYLTNLTVSIAIRENVVQLLLYQSRTERRRYSLNVSLPIGFAFWCHSKWGVASWGFSKKIQIYFPNTDFLVVRRKRDTNHCDCKLCENVIWWKNYSFLLSYQPTHPLTVLHKPQIRPEISFSLHRAISLHSVFTRQFQEKGENVICCDIWALLAVSFQLCNDGKLTQNFIRFV